MTSEIIVLQINTHTKHSKRHFRPVVCTVVTVNDCSNLRKQIVMHLQSNALCSAQLSRRRCHSCGHLSQIASKWRQRAPSVLCIGASAEDRGRPLVLKSLLVCSSCGSRLCLVSCLPSSLFTQLLDYPLAWGGVYQR